MIRTLLLSTIAVLASSAAAADTAPFDLAGPALRISVTHNGVTLPIAQVPQLATGDGLSIVADLPDDQAARFVLVAVFLRGSTNPPPDKWFEQAEAWTKKGRKGLDLTVPEGAQQVALFLAPATGGDFSTLRNAVRGRPGAFVRAAQELAQASLDRARLDTYLTAVRKTVPNDPKRLERISPLLARSLQVKINADCLTKLPDLQAACLLQNQESLVLADGHSNAITDAVQGPGADLALQLSATPQGGLGYYSPYIAAIRDVIGIFGSIRTAKYQYIPALAVLDGDRMGLVLNTPPSFHNPKSVIVTALPIIAPVHVPPLQLADANPVLCAHAGSPLLPVTGAPLIFATRYARDLSLRAQLPDGKTVDLPATPDAERGGLVIHIDDRLSALKTPIDGTLHGVWGFQPFDGPSVRLQPEQPGQWHISQATPQATDVTLTGGASACVTAIAVAGQPASWKALTPDSIRVTLPAGGGKGGGVLTIAGAAGTDPDRLTLAGPPTPVRFSATLIARNIQRSSGPVGTPSITFDGDDVVPSDASLTFSLKATSPALFSGHETIEVATEAGGSTTLAIGSGMTLADSHVVIVTMTPGTALGASAFGPLRARIVRDGTIGDWIALGTLVRLPKLTPVQCPADAKGPCTLSGERLFLVNTLSTTPGFDQPIAVPEGYPGATLELPHPANGVIYLRLHDAPSFVGRFASN